MNALPPLNALPLSPRWLLLWAQPNGLQSHLPNPPVSVILSGSPLAFSFIALTATYDYIFIVRLVLLFFFFFWVCAMAYGILVPWPGIKPGPSAVRVQSPNHWTSREFLRLFIHCLSSHKDVSFMNPW